MLSPRRDLNKRRTNNKKLPKGELPKARPKDLIDPQTIPPSLKTSGKNFDSAPGESRSYLSLFTLINHNSSFFTKRELKDEKLRRLSNLEEMNERGMRDLRLILLDKWSSGISHQELLELRLLYRTIGQLLGRSQ